MRTNFMWRFRSETGQRAEKISPFLFGLHGIENGRYLPVDRDLPSEGLKLKASVFDFGFNNASLALAPFQETDLNLVVRKNMLVWGIMAHRQVLTTNNLMPTEVIPPLLVNIYQQRDGKIFQWMNKQIAHLEAGGVARRPCILREPQIVLSGDSLQVNVQNGGNYNLAAQVVLYAGEFD